MAILVADGFDEVTMTLPRRALEQAGVETHLVASLGGPVRSWHHDAWGYPFGIDANLERVRAEGYRSLVIAGGVLGVDRLRRDRRAIELVRGFACSGRPIAAVCHGAALLVDAGVVTNRRVTSPLAIRTDVANAGATWLDEPVVQDGLVITCRELGDVAALSQLLPSALMTELATAA